MNYSNFDSRTKHPTFTATLDPRRFVTEVDRRGVRHLVLRRLTDPVRRGFRRLAPNVAFLFGMLSAWTPAPAQTANETFAAPSIDKWVYPFASNGGGGRTSAPIFGAIGNLGTFDDRDGQFLTGFGISGRIPAGQGAANYLVSSVRLTLSLNFNAADQVIWDGTFDPIASYDPATGAGVNDDPGRSIELYGAGYRGGFTATTLLENSAYAFGDPTAEGIRNFFATDYLGGSARDVSNNVRDAFDPIPFAIGQVAASDLNPDGTIKDAARITFDLNLGNPDVLGYLQAGLHAGTLNFLTTSLHSASQGGPANRPEFDAKELGVAGTPASLQIAVTIVPEPTAATLLGLLTLRWLGLRRRVLAR